MRPASSLGIPSCDLQPALVMNKSEGPQHAGTTGGGAPTSLATASHSAASKSQPPSSATCAICSEPFKGGDQVVANSSGKRLHARCFVCTKCKKPLSGKFVATKEEPNKPYHPECLSSAKSPGTCAKCGEGIPYGMRYLTVGEKVFHAACFVCTHCGEQLESSFAFKKDDPNSPYHHECLKQQVLPKCRVCEAPMHGKIAMNKYWRDQMCHAHTEGPSKLATCASCGRYAAKGQRLIQVDPDRKLCDDCQATAVFDALDAQPLYANVVHFFEDSLGLPLPMTPPLSLVDLRRLNGQQEQEMGHQHRSCSGLCVTEATIRVETKKSTGEVVKKERKVEVKAILVLSHLPRTLTGGIIAHESMHCWLKLAGYPLNLDSRVEEGLCQLAAMLWLDAQPPARRDRDPMAEKTNELSEYFKWRIANNAPTEYLEGYQLARRAYDRVGLQRLLQHVRQTGAFPELQMY
uniref:LIM zinc-binding domain-containing protein n=1 Tax=Chromera velia CCMP2878 TaxID=1169474 RepID=A0A0G4ICM9_9ALVE|eukprot:Cvel_13188.t1-p1 / transcript=Cvel_13188.t1 / gene=Cvel_13188 / organism=Chromera_velia_CCMP2878 / gene_product=Protein DA1, putative / transcript_product=Protein DA1, putative / location=Cvel_scaffold891:47524-49588(-) / protein_length=461 / sequence_SO=supercontig / SO=protein_coding / is_pseudo=false